MARLPVTLDTEPLVCVMYKSLAPRRKGNREEPDA